MISKILTLIADVHATIRLFNKDGVLDKLLGAFAVIREEATKPEVQKLVADIEGLIGEKE